ncbi:MAG TPA: energy transducer TonB [Rhizomicrobium sp.]|nr:energy transducer TonB [Rhizomicrobium sp.]
MTVSFPLDAFDQAKPVRLPRRPRPERGKLKDKLTGIGITLAVHAVILALALTAVHVAHPRMMQELSVRITPEKRKIVEDSKPLPKLAAPSVVTAPVPEITVQTPSPPPVLAQPPLAAPAPPVTAPAVQKPAGESRDSYLARVLAQLNRFKQYPRAARQARIEGRVMLHFVMTADGRVQSAEIAQSSGRPILDAEALALIQRAQPLPALPADFPTPTLDAVVPIEFSLNS